MKYFNLIFIFFTLLSTANAAPPFKTVSLKSAYVAYNSEKLVMEFNEAISGGCNLSTIAVSNPGAANNNENISFALSALMANKPIDIAFGGGCSSEYNWIQTIRISR